MFDIKVISNFSAAHFLSNYRGKCEAVHGHNWKVEVTASGASLDSLGMVMDFSMLKQFTEKVLDELDHRLLNDIGYFKEHHTTSEEIARYIYARLKDQMTASGCALDSVSVWETDTSCACYRGENI